MRIIAASAPLRRSPQADAPLETEALYGESVTVYDEQDGWAWAQLERDQYVGYLPAAALGAPSAPTHRVAALRTHAYPGPAIKLPPRMALSLGAQLTIVGREGDFAVSDDGLYLWSRSLAELSAQRTGLGRGRRALSRDALSLGRPDVRGHRLLGPGSDGADGGRDRLATRQRYDGGEAWASPSRSTTRPRRLRAAISCSGRATSGSCAIPSRCFTPTAGT